MRHPPFTSSAKQPIEFVPEIQDADGYKRKRSANIAKMQQASQRRLSAIDEELHKQQSGTVVQDADLVKSLTTERATVEVDLAKIPDEYGIMERNLDFMREKYPTPQRFILAVPTNVEREQINARLISLGLQQITQEQIRATMIEELYLQDWSEPGQPPLNPSENESAADDRANFLDGCWLRQQAHDAAIEMWQQQEVERLIDEMEGAPRREREEIPPKIISVREQARMQRLIDHMMTHSQRLRDLAAANVDFNRQNAVILVRMHLIGVQGFTPPMPIERNAHTRALNEDVVLALRDVVDDASWNEVVGFIDRMYQVDGSEEKNFDSLPEKLPLHNGSTGASESPASSDGNSTGSPSTPAPVAESATITEASSASTSGFDTVPVSSPEKPSPTVEG